MDRIISVLHPIWHVALYLAGRFSGDRCSQVAAALTYMSLFALVPLLTVSFTMASAIPSFSGFEEQVQNLIFNHMLPDTGTEIKNYLDDFSRQARNLTGFGVVFLVVTSVLMLRHIEQAFNTIWRTQKNRGAVASFLLYWAVLSLSPIFVGLGLGISTYLASLPILVDNLDAVGLRSGLLHYAPLALNWLAFTLIYAAVPNCPVPLRHAAIGGFIAALSFNTARFLFTKLVVGSSYTFIYGAFAVVPLFLSWIYLSWTIVLVGGIIVHSLSAYQSNDQAAIPPVLKALNVLHLLWQRQQHGGTVREIELFSGRHKSLRGLDSDTWSQLRKVLLDKRVITQNQRGHYLLARDLDTLPLWQLKEWINEERPLQSGVNDIETWQSHAHNLLYEQKRQQRDLLNTSLNEIFRYTDDENSN